MEIFPIEMLIWLWLWLFFFFFSGENNKKCSALYLVFTFLLLGRVSDCVISCGHPCQTNEMVCIIQVAMKSPVCNYDMHHQA